MNIFSDSVLDLFSLGSEIGGNAVHRNSDEIVPYEGSKSNNSSYNFCYLCKERLDTYYDEHDENWYFVNTKQIRFISGENNNSGKKDEK